MNKGQLIEALAKTQEMTKADAGRTVDAMLDILSGALKKEGEVSLAGFGTFKLKKRAARMGRNPKTKEPIKIKASKTVGFKPAAALKAAL